MNRQTASPSGRQAVGLAVIMSVVLLGAAPAHALERYCKATAVFDTGFLDENFSLKDFPDVVVSADEVVLGSTLFSVEKSDLIKEVISVGLEKNIEITQKNGDVRYFININNLPTNKTGTLAGQFKGEPASKIADLDCK